MEKISPETPMMLILQKHSRGVTDTDNQIEHIQQLYKVLEEKSATRYAIPKVIRNGMLCRNCGVVEDQHHALFARSSYLEHYELFVCSTSKKRARDTHTPGINTHPQTHRVLSCA